MMGKIESKLYASEQGQVKTGLYPVMLSSQRFKVNETAEIRKCFNHNLTNFWRLGMLAAER